MTADQMIQKAAELTAKADLLDSALLAPSMKSNTLRDEASELTAKAALIRNSLIDRSR